VLHRHNTVLDELFAQGGDEIGEPRAIVITCSWSTDAQPAHPDRVVYQRETTPEYWRSLEDDGSWTHLWVHDCVWSPGRLDDLLLDVAFDRTAGVVISTGSLAWLYHPYDGGADVIAPTGNSRDNLRSAHAPWLSTHPSGL